MKKITVILFLLVVAIGSVYAMKGKKTNLDKELSKYNFHEVIPGKVYRSAQLDLKLLAKAIEVFGIKSILNLRTYSNKSEIKKNERELADKLNIAYYHVPLRSKYKITAKSKGQLLEYLGEVKKKLPVLIHCQHGKNRTSLATASLLKLHFGYSDEKIIEQFDSKIYGFKGKFAWMVDFVLSLGSKK
jgi:protein tyrosine/serine phosphatase